ncbi:MAG: ribosome assembly RNA-binding protein YhbY [Gemmatimonadaceae bacterium]
MTDQSPLSGKDRASLRAEAHHLTPTVHVGQHGLTPAVIQSLDDALRTRELVKVQLGRQVDVKARDAAQALAIATGASVVQVIGKTATLYRENPDLPRKKGDLPPWRR